MLTALSRRERMELDWSEMLEHKVTMLNHNFHYFPPFTHEVDSTGSNTLEWEDDIREMVGWVSQCNNKFIIHLKI